MSEPRWLLLAHQLPTRLSNARVKTWRRLQQLGAVPARNSVYVLPNSEQSREDFEWLRSEIVALGGEATVFTADAISGNVDVKTGDGSITVLGGKGAVRLRTGDGHIDGKDLDGNVDVTTGDGSVNLDGRFDVLNVKTGDGSVTVRARSGSRVSNPWNLHTGDGSIDLDLPGELQANIDASTHDGHISLGIPVTVEGTFSSSRISGKMNGGGQVIQVRTGDGSIHLSKT